MQDDIFEHTTAPLLRKFLNGENCVLFAYGMTNAGKTYTVQGTNSNPGILPKLVTAVLDEMAKSTSEWDLHVSMLEIYQENIYDLLAKKKKEKLSIRDANGKVEVNKLSTHSIKSTKDACKLMDTAAYNRYGYITRCHGHDRYFLKLGFSCAAQIEVIDVPEHGLQSLARGVHDHAGPLQRGGRLQPVRGLPARRPGRRGERVSAD
jgi:hypothetical protein